MQKAIKIIENKIKELKDYEDMWLHDLDENPNSLIANTQIDKLYNQILVLNEVLTEIKETEVNNMACGGRKKGGKKK